MYPFKHYLRQVIHLYMLQLELCTNIRFDSWIVGLRLALQLCHIVLMTQWRITLIISRKPSSDFARRGRSGGWLPTYGDLVPPVH